MIIKHNEAQGPLQNARLPRRFAPPKKHTDLSAGGSLIPIAVYRDGDGCNTSWNFAIPKLRLRLPPWMEGGAFVSSRHWPRSGSKARNDKFPILPILFLGAIQLLTLFSAPARAARLDEMSLDSWAKLREVERYQLQIAEKYYRQKNWKIAMAEYEKFLTLYEQSDGAAYSQLKWSLCLVHLRKINTAIKDGFQSVIDYWPDSPQAVSAAYYIGKSYKDMGEVEPARKA